MSSRQTIMERINGTIRLQISSIRSPVMVDATKRLEPNGGVQKPIASATVIITPKWMGSYPMLVTMGRKIL